VLYYTSVLYCLKRLTSTGQLVMKRSCILFSQTLLLWFALLGATQLASAAPDTWTGGGIDAKWGTPGNWDTANPPNPGDSLIFGSSGGGTLVNNLTDGTAFDGLTFNGSATFTLNGPSSVLLSGQAYANTIGIVNSSGLTQTIGTMPLKLDWGYYTFSSPSGTLALDSAITPNLGGVAYFGANITSPLTADGTTGLIPVLNGAGLIYSGSTPTDLATISGGSILAYTYSGPNIIASGGLPAGAGNNIELSPSGGALVNFTAGTISVNTIRALNIGNTSGTTGEDILATTGTLTLGDKGGFYVLNATAGNKNCLILTNGTITAGTSAGATLIFAVDGTTSGNQLAVNSTIANNSGGAVTVVTAGSGSLYFAGANSYSGGTYVLQGQLQGNNFGSFGSGPIYVASGATAWLNGGVNVTYVNDLYISPGTGTTLETGTTTSPGALLLTGASAGGNVYYNGKLTLLGAPVPAATYPPTAGCRITGNRDATLNYNFQNQITGTGTLDLNASPHATVIILKNNPANHPLNDWQGGLIIEESLASASSARNITVQLGFDNQIPHGASAGDVTLYTADSSANNTIVRLDLNGHTNTINGLHGSYVSHPPQVSNFGSAPSVLTLGDNNATGTFNGLTTDNSGANNLSLVKIGSGTQTFTGALGHHGNTTVSNGTFVLGSGSTIANSPVITVASAGTLDATGIGGLTVGSAQTLNCVGTVLGNTIINGTVKALDAIGALTNTGNMTFNTGGKYVWDINEVQAPDGAGAAGSNLGWSLLNISGTLDVGSLTSGSFTINATSLSLADAAGFAATGFNPAHPYTWNIAYAAGGITGFSASQFVINTSGFVGSAGSWTVGVDNSGDYLQLNYNPFQVIIVPIKPSTETVNQLGNAIFSVVANPLYSATFAWTQNGNPLSGGQSAGGAPGNVTIATTSGPTGITNTLTIARVDSVVEAADGGAIGVTVTEASSPAPSGVLATPATLTVIDTPYIPNVTSSFGTPPVTGGAVDVLAATASGTQPFTYQWYLGTNAIGGATGSSFNVNVSPATVGSYTVVICNAAGCVTSSPPVEITGPITEVPNQILYEPFNYAQQPSVNPATWDAPGVTQVYNQATGVGLPWTQVGNNDFSTRAGPIDTYEGFTWLTTPPGTGNRPLITDQYPVEGLAGNSPNLIYIDTDVNGGQENLHFGAGGAITNGKVYVSFVIQLWGFDGNGASGNHIDYVCGLGTGDANSTTHSVGIYSYQPLPANTWPNIGYTLGVFKGNLTTGALNPGVNGDWAPGNPSVPPGDHTAFLDFDILFVVMRYNIDPGGHSTCDLWVNPDRSFFYTNEANLPTPTVANVAGSVADQAGAISLFWAKATTYPVDRNLLDLRVGTTWASVTPPAAPTLSLANVLLSPTDTVAVLASQNAGNPVNSGVTAGNPPYQWQFTPPGGSPTTLSDGTGPSGHSTISGSSTDTLTIRNPAPGDLGTYTLTEINTSPSSYDLGIPRASYTGPGLTYTNSVSAILTTNRPSLSVTASGGNVIVSWPVNWPVALEATTSLAPPIAWTPVSAGESSFLYWPPGSGLLSWVPVSPITISGTNYTVTLAPGSTSQMFFRLAPSP
jgi:autotransporter-associated beta strand protein